MFIRYVSVKMRKTTADVKETKSSSSKASLHWKDIVRHMTDGLSHNWMTYLWFAFVIVGIFQLRAFIGGILSLTIGLALIFGIFWSSKQ